MFLAFLYVFSLRFVDKRSFRDSENIIDVFPYNLRYLCKVRISSNFSKCKNCRTPSFLNLNRIQVISYSVERI